MATRLTSFNVTLEECETLRRTVYGPSPDPAACIQYDAILRELRLLAMGAGLDRHTAETRPVDWLFRYVSRELSLPATRKTQVEPDGNILFA